MLNSCKILFIEVEGVKFRCKVKGEPVFNETVPVFLHGFTGNLTDWDFLLDTISKGVSIDLIGHGESDSPSKLFFYSSKKQVELIVSVLTKINVKKCILIGYSMGARLCLAIYFSKKLQIQKILLESGTAGIDSFTERLSRRLNDKKLIKKLKKTGVNKFMESWLNQPMFESIKQVMLPSEYEEFVKIKSHQNEVGLVNALLEFGTGSMPSFWKELKNIHVHTLLITGGLDVKFCKLNIKMKNLIPKSKHVILNNCGHNTHLEKPKEFINLAKCFFTH